MLGPERLQGRRALLLALAVLAFVPLAGLYERLAPEQPRAGEAGWLMMGESLLHDRDLRCGPADLERAWARWSAGPGRLRLATVDGGRSFHYPDSPLLPLLTLPLLALFGADGLLAANLLLLAGLLWWARGRPGPFGGRGGVALLALLATSTAAGYWLVAQPHALLMGLLLLAVGAWCGGSAPVRFSTWWWIGAALGLAAATLPPLAWIGAAVLLDLLLSRRLRSAAVLAAAAAAIWAAGFLAQGLATGLWPGASAPPRVVVVAAAELSAEGSAPPEAVSPPAASAWGGPEPLRRILREAWTFLVGRMGGLLPHFPLLLPLLLLAALWAEERRSLLLAYALLGLSAHLVWLRAAGLEPEPLLRGHGVVAAAYPLLLLLAPGPSPGGRRLRWALLAPFALAALLWVLPGWPGPLAGERFLARPRILPLELTHLEEVESFGLELRRWERLVAVVPAAAVRADRAGSPGLWVPAGPELEIWLVSAAELRPLEVGLRGSSPRLRVRLRSGHQVVEAAMDTPGKRRGVPARLDPRPLARRLGGYFPREAYYSFRVWVEASPAGPEEPRLGAARQQGVHLDFSAASGTRPGREG